MACRLPKRSRKVALLEGVTAGALFGTAAVLIRLLPGLNVFSIAFWRLAIASLILSVLILSLRKPFGSNLLRENFREILVLGFLLGLHFMLFVSAVMNTTILNATVLVNTTPIWSMFVSALVFKVKPSQLAILGVSVSFVGVGIIAYSDFVSSQGVLTPNFMGDLEAVLAAVAEAFYLSYGRKTRSRVPLLSLMLIIYLASALTILAAGVLASSPFTLPSKLEIMLPLIGLGILPTALAHTFYFSSLSNLKSYETATMALLEPIGATMLGVIIFAEIPNVLFVAGAVFVLGGIISVAVRE